MKQIFKIGGKMNIKDTLRQLVEIQIEQNDLALKVAYEEAIIQRLDIRDIVFVPLHLKEGHQKLLIRYKATFEENQKRLRELVVEVAQIPSQF